MPDATPPNSDPASVLRLLPHSIETVPRDGYVEYRCTPASWTYAEPKPFRELLAEFYSERADVDPHGHGEDRNFWSGSDAALRLRANRPVDLAVHEMIGLATRRAVGLNSPKAWIAWDQVIGIASQWESGASDIHWWERAKSGDDDPVDAWSHYGMVAELDSTVTYGYGMTGVSPPPARDLSRLRAGGPGLFHRWADVARWETWPRRQDLAGTGSASAADDGGVLRLFVSHRWDTPSHPDPDGGQLLALKVGLTLALAAALHVHEVPAGSRTGSRLPEILAAHLNSVDPRLARNVALLTWAKAVERAARAARDEHALWPALVALERPAVGRTLARIRRSVGIWYDYASMFQVPRDDDEERSFRAEILRLNDIQASACTVVLTGGSDYLGRAWCFLELCGGMRGTIAELTPTWGHRISAGGAATSWASRSDQLIGALRVHGLDTISSCGLRASDDADLPIVAALLAELPLTMRVETADSDLIGGTMPLPRTEAGWITAPAPEPPARSCRAATLHAAGRVAETRDLHETARVLDDDVGLAGPLGFWVYTTQRALSLSWAARAGEIWSAIEPALDGWRAELGDAAPGPGAQATVTCCWADARALADNGEGWARVVPSAVRLLVIVTQAELWPICRLYDRTLRVHLAAGVPVLTYAPATGHLQLHLPEQRGASPPEYVPAHVLAVPRIRRSQAYVRYQLMSAQAATAERVEVLAALRLEPSEGFVPTNHTVPQTGPTATGEPVTITHRWLVSHAAQRARAEALARCTTSSWDTWGAPRLHAGAWAEAIAPSQLDTMEALVRQTLAVSDNPLRRRKLLYIVVKEEEGYALPPQLPETTGELVRRILADPGAARG